jgi:hypothetical protein
MHVKLSSSCPLWSVSARRGVQIQVNRAELTTTSARRSVWPRKWGQGKESHDRPLLHGVKWSSASFTRSSARIDAGSLPPSRAKAGLGRTKAGQACPWTWPLSADHTVPSVSPQGCECANSTIGCLHTLGTKVWSLALPGSQSFVVG